MKEQPFESLSKGLNKDLSGLVDTDLSNLSKSLRPSQLSSVFGIGNLPIGLVQGREESFGQQPFESLSDRFAHQVAVFPLANHVIINKLGAFIPQSIFGTDIDIAYKEGRNQSGAIEITVHAKQPPVSSAYRSEFGSASGVVEISHAFDEPLRKDDPIFDIGRDPVACGVSDASENLDKYLYGG